MDPIITSALTSFVTTLATNSSKAPLQTLDDLWYLAFGRLNHFVQLKRAKNEMDVTQYKDSLARKILAINEENLQEPPLSVVGPALEASKYYIEEEELREMFAKIIASSMDKTKSANVHHSFVEIVKQMSPRDAKNISLFVDGKLTHPVVEYRSTLIGTMDFNSFITNIFTSDPIYGSIDENDSPSITNLIRLGLLSVSYDEYFTDDLAYHLYENGPFVDYVKAKLIPSTHELKVKKGLLRITPLGQSFVLICV